MMNNHEGSFAWIAFTRRLIRDYELSLVKSEVIFEPAMTLLLAKRLS